jgi:hypothetical protein
LNDGQNFEPYFDWGQIDEEMTTDLHEAIVAYRKATDAFVEEGSAEKARALMQSQHEVGMVAEAIRRTVWTQPVMVHIAGQKKAEVDDEGHDTIIQRCKRCGSTLQLWHEGVMVLGPSGPHELRDEDIPWWEEGAVVAKHTDEVGMGLFEIEGGRDLEAHEKMCPDFADQLGSG